MGTWRVETGPSCSPTGNKRGTRIRETCSSGERFASGPEYAGRVAVHLVENDADVGCWADQVVEMPAAVAVAAVERPEVALGRVAQTCDASARPLGAVVLASGRSAFDDGRRASAEHELGADLMEGIWWDALLAVVADGGDVEPREHAMIVVRPHNRRLRVRIPPPL
jgi:hypothetical protein